MDDALLPIRAGLFDPAAVLCKLPNHASVCYPPGLARAETQESLDLTKFTDLGLAEPILRSLAGEGYEAPTPIQAQVIPAMLGGDDVVGIAQTGTGKTASFVLPLLQAITERGKRPAAKCCHALVLAPTRELAAQIEDNIRIYGKYLKLRSAVIVGGAKPGPQVRSMAPGVDILVATPGRLEDHIATGAVRIDTASAVVLDEADQMLDLGFMPAIRRLMGKLPKARQTVLMSATMPSQIRKLAGDFLKRPVEISVAPQSKPIDRIDQSVMHVSREEKRDKLISYLKSQTIERAVVFTRTKHGANKVAQMLERAGIPAGAIHGNKSQSQRIKTLDAFKKGSVPVLVATDIAARGIDVDGVSHVINFDLPEVAEVYVHRIGRTARAGASGIAVALVDESQRGLLRDVEKLIKMKLPSLDGSTPDLPEVEPEKPGKQPRRNQGSGRRRPAKARPEQGRSLSKKASKPEDGPSRPKTEDNKQTEPKKAKRRRRSRKQSANTVGGSTAGLNRMLGNIDRSNKSTAGR